MTLDVYRARKTTIQQQQQNNIHIWHTLTSGEDQQKAVNRI